MSNEELIACTPGRAKRRIGRGVWLAAKGLVCGWVVAGCLIVLGCMSRGVFECLRFGWKFWDLL